MKFKIILLLFCSPLMAAYENDPPLFMRDVSSRIHLRYPSEPRITSTTTTVDKSWEKFWEELICVGCAKPAPDCNWLNAQKEDVRRVWIERRRKREGSK